MSKKRKIVFKMVMSDSVTLASEMHVNIPDTASMPYLLTKIANKANGILPNVELDKNYATVLMWFYNRHYLENHDLATQENIIETITDIVTPFADASASTDDIYKTAKDIAEMILMPNDNLKVIDELNASDQSALVCGAIVWSMLVNNRTIKNETEINFVELLDSCDRSKGYIEQIKAAISLVNRTVELNLRKIKTEYTEEVLLSSES